MRYALRSHNVTFCRHFIWLALGILSLTGLAFGQYGVSPSQTGMFFDDLRGRSNARMNGSGVQSTDGTYDFSQNGTFQQGPDGMGSVVQNANSQISQAYNGTGNQVYSQRQAADYTQYSGPYASGGTFFAPSYTADPFLGGRRNMHIGPVNLGFGLTAIGEFNDNVSRSSVNPTSDYILSTFLNVSANYQITQKTGLSLSTAIGFDHYFEHPELAPYGKDFVLNILPGSTLSFDAMIGPVYVVAYDRMSVRPATQNDFSINANNVFGVIQNDAGFAAAWDINSRTTLSVNFTHSTAKTLESNDPKLDYSNYDRDMDTLQASIAWSPDGICTLGLEGSIAWVKYPHKTNLLSDITLDISPSDLRLTYGRNFKNDGQTANIGAFFTAPLGKTTSVKVSAGVQDFNFDSPAGDKFFDADSLSDFYYNVTLSNRLTSRISQALNFGHESALNTVSNYITADHVSYGVGIIGWSGSRLSISSYYEQSEDSIGKGTEVVDQYGIDVYLSQQLTSRVRAGVGYHYGVSNSNLSQRSYTQQAFNVDLSYALTQKLLLSLGYRFQTTDADDSQFDFDQNRVVFSANYNF